MTVAELIAILQRMPQDVPVAYRIYSEQALLETADVEVVELCRPRSDGWIQDRRPDMPAQAYVRFP